MKMLFVYLFLLNFIQGNIKFKLVDEKNKTSIQFATIFFNGQFKKAMYTDSLGNFSIINDPNSYIKIIALGYEEKIVYLYELNDSLISMKEKITTLPDVIVKNIENKNITFHGFLDLKSNKIIYPGATGQIITVLLPPSEELEYRKIYKLKYKISNYSRMSDKMTDGIVRPKLYSVNNNSPYKDILNNNIIYRINKKQSEIIIDISKYNILFPKEGLFIGLEWIGEIEKKVNININPGYLMSYVNYNPHQYISFYGETFSEIKSEKNGFLAPIFGVEIK